MDSSCPVCGRDRVRGAVACACGHIFPLGETETAIGPSEWAPSKSVMTGAGWLLIIVGVLIAGYALLWYDPSIDAYVPGDLDSIGRRINNTGLLQRQVMLFLGGCFAALAGTIAACVGVICDKLNNQAKPTPLISPESESDTAPN